MDFQSVNILNVRLNKISGNLLPMTVDSGFPIFWKIHGVLTWLFVLIRTCGFIPGLMVVSKEKVLVDGMTSVMFITEVIFLNVQIHRRGKLVQRFVFKLNNILSVENKIMKDLVMATMKPIIIAMNCYWMFLVLSTLIWALKPFLLLFKKSEFYYKDYRMPLVYCKEPFSAKCFVFGSVIITFASSFICLKKSGVDIYMIHMVVMMTIQYRYIAKKFAAIFREGSTRDERGDSASSLKANSWTEKELKVLCRHHNAVIHMSFLLKKLLSMNFNLIHVIGVMRFCFCAITLYAARKLPFFDGILVMLFEFGGVTQFYILCSSVHELLDASTEMTDMAFHEDWYRFGPSVKRLFMLMILSSNLECKLTTCEQLSLTLPSFMSIMNQAYSVALLVTKMN